MFPRRPSASLVFMPNMEAAGIEPAQDSPGWVYLVSDGSSYKIGWAVNPEKRLATLQTGNIEHLKIKAVIEAPRGLEREIHDLFGLHRIRGEWFTAAPDIDEYFETYGWTCTCLRRAIDPACFIHSEEMPAW